MNKNIITLGALMGTLIVITGCGQVEQNAQVQQGQQVKTNVQETQQVQQDFDKSFLAFNEPYKKALLATGKAKKEESVMSIKSTLSKWQELEKTFIDNQPSQYAQTQDWNSKLSDIGVLISDADKLIEGDELKEAHEKLEKVRAQLREIRAENGHILLTDNMLEFHDAMEVVVEDGVDGKNDEHIANMVELLNSLINASDVEDKEQYNEMVNELKAVVEEVQNAKQQDYQDAINKLKPAFIKLYMQFG